MSLLWQEGSYGWFIPHDHDRKHPFYKVNIPWKQFILCFLPNFWKIQMVKQSKQTEPKQHANNFESNITAISSTEYSETCHVSMFVCVCACMCVCMRAHVCVCVCVCVCVHMCVWEYVHAQGRQKERDKRDRERAQKRGEREWERDRGSKRPKWIEEMTVSVN